MAKTKYVIALTKDERNTLKKIIEEKTESDRTLLRARILLLSDINTAEKMSIPKLADQLGTTHSLDTSWLTSLECDVYILREIC